MGWAVAALLAPLAVPGGPWVGFVDHFPFLPSDGPPIGQSGATVALVRVPWTEVERAEGAWDVAFLDRQLAWAAEQNVRLLYVIECGPAHVPNWLRAKLEPLGERQVGPTGALGPDPSIFSPTYARALDRFVAGTVTALRDHPHADRILGYCNGCEWWYPDLHAFAEPDRAAFEAAMIAKYGGRAAARAAWGLGGDGRLERPAVLLEAGGGRDHFAELVPIAERFDGCYMTHGDHLAVEPGRRYRLEADVRLRRRIRGAVYLQIAWLGEQPAPLRVVNSTMSASGEWARLHVEDTAPAGATRAWLLLKTCALGESSFGQPSFRAVDGPELLADKPLTGAAWTQQVWESPEPESVTFVRDGAGSSITCLRADRQAISEAWVDDWFDFLDGATAEFIGTIADRIRAVDPSRPLVAYLTMSFAAPFCWDDSYGTHISPSRVFAARRYDGLGMQLASADGDADHVTAAIDMVRRQGTPWMIDLQDFTAGIHVGREVMTRTTLAGIDAGARGVCYYGWFDPNVPDYSFGDGWAMADIRAMVGAAKARLAELGETEPPVDIALLHPAVPPLPGRGEPDPGRFMLLYKAVRRLGLHPAIVNRGEEPPPGVPLLTVDDVPADLHPEVLRSTEAGNTPPMFKFLPTPANEAKLSALARRLAAR